MSSNNNNNNKNKRRERKNRSNIKESTKITKKESIEKLRNDKREQLNRKRSDKLEKRRKDSGMVNPAPSFIKFIDDRKNMNNIDTLNHNKIKDEFIFLCNLKGNEDLKLIFKNIDDIGNTLNNSKFNENDVKLISNLPEKIFENLTKLLCVSNDLNFDLSVVILLYNIIVPIPSINGKKICITSEFINKIIKTVDNLMKNNHPKKIEIVSKILILLYVAQSLISNIGDTLISLKYVDLLLELGKFIGSNIKDNKIPNNFIKLMEGIAMNVISLTVFSKKNELLFNSLLKMEIWLYNQLKTVNLHYLSLRMVLYTIQTYDDYFNSQIGNTINSGIGDELFDLILGELSNSVDEDVIRMFEVVSHINYFGNSTVNKMDKVLDIFYRVMNKPMVTRNMIIMRNMVIGLTNICRGENDIIKKIVNHTESKGYLINSGLFKKIVVDLFRNTTNIVLKYEIGFFVCNTIGYMDEYSLKETISSEILDPILFIFKTIMVKIENICFINRAINFVGLILLRFNNPKITSYFAKDFLNDLNNFKSRMYTTKKEVDKTGGFSILNSPNQENSQTEIKLFRSVENSINILINHVNSNISNLEKIGFYNSFNNNFQMKNSNNNYLMNNNNKF